jgi:hypothetical protein
LIESAATVASLDLLDIYLDKGISPEASFVTTKISPFRIAIDDIQIAGNRHRIV